MANKKKPPGFMIYLGDCKWLKVLTLEQRGQLLDALVSYADAGECVIDDGDSALKLLFDTMADAIDRDREKYNDTCDKNSDNARKGWESKRRKPTNSDATACDGMRTDATACEEMRNDANTNPISKPITKTNNNDIGGKPPARAKFVPPTIDEVADYCQERNNYVNPSKWYDHYLAVDWMVGKNKMKDWRAAVRKWEQNGFNNSSPETHPETIHYGFDR